MQRRDDTGASAVEYAILVAAIAAVIFATVLLLGSDVLGLFQTVDGAF